MNGDTIKRMRKLKEVSQIELAKRTGIYQPYISYIESGKRLVTEREKRLILKALKINKTQLAILMELETFLWLTTEIEKMFWGEILQQFD